MSTDENAFRLSRVYAQGWNAAHKLSPGAEAAKDAGIGPYPADPERTVWQQGFSDASA